MANNFDISNAAATAAANAVTALVNGGTLRIYAGTKPSGPDTALSGATLLASLSFSATAFGSASNGVATANSITAATASNGGTLRIYSGTKPATPGDALSGNTLLVQHTFGSTAFGSASSGAATNNAISAVTASATGTASFFRAYSSGGTAVFQGTCGTSDADLVLSSTSISSGGSVSVANGALTYTQPAG